jgi:hypothetical protein
VGVKKNSALWVLVLFFGASIVFAGLRRLTEGDGAGVTLAVQLAALAVIVTVIVVVMRRRR